MMDADRRMMKYPTIIQQHNQMAFFTKRIELLRSITSPHMFPFDQARIADFPIIFYQQPTLTPTLASLITPKVDLLPTEIKTIVWQLTKFMLHCQARAISHLRLCPSALVLKEEWEPDRPIFIRVKDFSLGKEFQSVSEGKQLDFFEFLHPELSIGNQTADFRICQSNYDIWSLGVILYQLIYKRSPFRKEGRAVFSKTILRSFLNKQYEVRYLDNKYSSINKLISRCFEAESGFKGWQDVMQWIVTGEEIYNQLDFHNGPFDEQAEMHLRLMTLFSGIYCMIFEQCKNSPHPFWRKPISHNQPAPFHITIAEFTLCLMKLLEDRFQRLYSNYFDYISCNEVREALMMVSKKLALEVAHMCKKGWREEKFSRGQFTLQTIRAIQQVCAKVELELSELAPQRNSYREGRGKHRNSFAIRKLWKSMQTLRDYCGEVIYILNQSKTRMKYIYQQFYISKTFEVILMQDFGYKGRVPINLSKILKHSHM